MMRLSLVLLLTLLGATESLLAASSGDVTVTVTIQQLVGVDVAAPVDQGGDPGQMLTYLFTVQNAGTGPDVFDLKATSSEHFAVALPGGTTTGTLNPGGLAQVTVELTIPNGEPAGTQDRLTLSATSQTARKISDEASVTTTVNQVARVAMQPPHDQRGRRGETLTYRFRVENTGNGTDRFRLTANSSRGWAVFLPGGDLTAPLTMGPGAGSQTTVEVEVTVPLTETIGTQDVLTLTATSQFDLTVLTQTSVTSTVVKRGGGLP